MEADGIAEGHQFSLARQGHCPTFFGDQQTQRVAAIGEPERSAVACAIGRGEAASRCHGEKTGRLLDTLRAEH